MCLCPLVPDALLGNAVPEAPLRKTEGNKSLHQRSPLFETTAFFPHLEQSSGDGIPRRILGTRGNKPLMNHAVAAEWDAMVLEKVTEQIAIREVVRGSFQTLITTVPRGNALVYALA